jgi:hypothetical protein
MGKKLNFLQLGAEMRCHQNLCGLPRPNIGASQHQVELQPDRSHLLRHLLGFAASFCRQRSLGIVSVAAALSC